MDKEVITYALKALSVKHFSKNILVKKIHEKFEISDTDLKEILEYLEANRFLDDNALTDSILHSLASKGYGPLRMKQKLYQKELSIDESKFKEYLNLAKEQLRKKLKSRFPESSSLDKIEPKELAKIIRFVQGRGFNLSVKEILNEDQ